MDSRAKVSNPIHPPQSKASVQNYSRKTTARPRDSLMEDSGGNSDRFLENVAPFRLRWYSDHPAAVARGRHLSKDGEGRGEITPLERVSSYSRVMYAHTEWQMKRATVPEYQRMMHEFTTNQLRHKENAIKSAMSSAQTSSPRI